MTTFRSYHVRLLSEALAPISHMARTEGNEAIVAREQVVTDRGVVQVPVLSGNALRHRMLREPLALELVERWDLRGRLSLLAMNFLLHGGNLTESTAHERLRRIAEGHRLLPMVKLLGGSLPDQILSGCVTVLRGTLVCRENARALAAWAPAGWEIPGPLLPAQTFLGRYQYVRQDAAKRLLHVKPPEAAVTREDGSLFPDAAKQALAVEEEAPSSQMIVAGECVLRGAFFAHGLVTQRIAAHELGALLHALDLWQEAGGTIGGQSARGHGALRTRALVTTTAGEPVPDDELTFARSAYDERVTASRDEGVAWLEAAFS